MLRFVVIHRHFKHVIAADTNAMDFRPGLAASVRIGGTASSSGRLRLCLWRLAHAADFITKGNASRSRPSIAIAKTTGIPPPA